MQPLNQFNDNLGTAILVTGGAGVGKTSLALRLYPKTYVLVADLNFKSGVDYLKKIGKVDNVIGFDTVSPDETGKIIPPVARYPRMLEKLSAASVSPEVDCIVIDSATFVEDIIKARICGATDESKIKLSGYAQWGDLLITWKGIILQLRQSGKKLIMVVHEEKSKDESDGIYKYQIALDGAIADKMPALFSDVWRCEINERVESGKMQHVWEVRMLGNVRQEHLKRSSQFSDLPAVVSQNALVDKIWKSIQTPSVVT